MLPLKQFCPSKYQLNPVTFRSENRFIEEKVDKWSATHLDFSHSLAFLRSDFCDHVKASASFVHSSYDCSKQSCGTNQG